MTQHELDRRRLISQAREKLTEAMLEFTQDKGLTPLEWLDVLAVMQARVIATGLSEEWRQ